MSVYYEREFPRPLVDVRREIGVVLPPAALFESGYDPLDDRRGKWK